MKVVTAVAKFQRIANLCLRVYVSACVYVCGSQRVWLCAFVHSCSEECPGIIPVEAACLLCLFLGRRKFFLWRPSRPRPIAWPSMAAIGVAAGILALFSEAVNPLFSLRDGRDSRRKDRNAKLCACPGEALLRISGLSLNYMLGNFFHVYTHAYVRVVHMHIVHPCIHK